MCHGREEGLKRGVAERDAEVRHGREGRREKRRYLKGILKCAMIKRKSGCHDSGPQPPSIMDRKPYFPTTCSRRPPRCSVG